MVTERNQCHREHNITIFLVEQNANLALKTADQGYVLENGRVTIHDQAANLLVDENVRKAYMGI